MNAPRSVRRTRPAAFTLVEMLVSMVILAMILAVLLTLTAETDRAWKNTTTRVDAFKAAREGFEAMTRQISQATLNTYYEYYQGNTVWDGVSGAPTKYDRYSELHFISGPLGGNGTTLLPPSTPTWSGETASFDSRPGHGVFFQAPLGYNPPDASTTTSTIGLDKLLNACGFYVEYNSDQPARPNFIVAQGAPPRYRYRLMQLVQASRDLEVYNPDQYGPQTAPSFDKYTKWFRDAVPGSVRPLAENIVLLTILPELTPADAPNASSTSLTTDYLYDSRTLQTDPLHLSQLHQLPPMLHVTMVAIDEPSALRYCTTSVPPTGIASAVGGSKFTNTSDNQSDLDSVKSELQALHVNYRVFSTDVSIAGSKWSAQ